MNSDFDASVKVPLKLPLKMSLPEKVNTVNLESASFVVIMLLHEGLTHIQSQKRLGCILARVLLQFADNSHYQSFLSTVA